MAGEQYQTLRSVSDNHVHVICRDGEFEQIPDYIRHQGPWQVMRRGEVIQTEAHLPPPTGAIWLRA